jgi:hypothetical protein
MRIFTFMHILVLYQSLMGALYFGGIQSLWIGHILRRNCLLQQVIEGKIKGG